MSGGYVIHFRVRAQNAKHASASCLTPVPQSQLMRRTTNQTDRVSCQKCRAREGFGKRAPGKRESS